MIYRLIVKGKELSKEDCIRILDITNEKFICQSVITKEDFKKKFERFMKFGECVIYGKEVIQ